MLRYNNKFKNLGYITLWILFEKKFDLLNTSTCYLSNVGDLNKDT